MPSPRSSAILYLFGIVLAALGAGQGLVRHSLYWFG